VPVDAHEITIVSHLEGVAGTALLKAG
jgi:hypothetical protein